MGREVSESLDKLVAERLGNIANIATVRIDEGDNTLHASVTIIKNDLTTEVVEVGQWTAGEGTYILPETGGATEPRRMTIEFWEKKVRHFWEYPGA